ncbi:MAG: hypothetical protein JSR23_10495 [Proteobacteria bacterium]|nr:hypothetical protein [Pseudomonadota bacterium]
MKKPWVRVASGSLFSVFFAAWTGAKWLLDWLGRVDAFKALFADESSVSVVLKLLAGTPVWVPSLCALGFTAVTIWMIARPTESKPVAAQSGDSKIGVSREPPADMYVPTRLLLQFQAAGLLPRVVDQKNIHCWHAFSTDVHMDFQSADGKHSERGVLARSWSVFIAFDVPIKYQQLTVDAGGVGLPPHKIEVSNQRYAIVNFWADLAGSTVSFQSVPE